ncbi:MAG: hypothetical protein IKA05_09265 [Clostridia bacterium]|nr:hypothetical protein [Clostridia bacterium]
MSQATSDGGVFPLNKPRYSYPNRHGWGSNINKKIPQGKNNKGDLPMKKNTMMRIASCLLIAVLVTTCVISGTFAKYVTEYDASDSARVAKWGVTVVVEGDEAMFANEYTDDIASNPAPQDDAEVKGASSAKVIAPGTEGDLGSIAINGTPEVAVEVKIAVDLDLVGTLGANAWIINTTELYCPLVIKVDGTEYKIAGDVDTLEELEAAVELAVINAALQTTYTSTSDEIDTTTSEGTTICTVQYAPLENFGTAPATDVEVTWEWDFGDVAATNAKDTALGNAATSTIEMTISASVAQIDTYEAPVAP